MAIERICGWEAGNLGDWIAGGAASVIAARTGHSGSYCLSAASTQSATLNITAASEKYFHIRYEPSTNSLSNILSVKHNTTVLCAVWKELTTGFAQAVVTATPVATATLKPMVTGSAYTLQIYIKIADSGGRIVVKIDNQTVVDYTGDTKPGADTTFNVVHLGYTGNNGGYFDDFVMRSDDYPGNNLRIEGIVPTGAGATTAWDPSSAPNWDCVNEKPYSDTDYNSTNVSNEVDTFVMGDLTADISSILAVQVQARCAYEGSPTPTHIQLVVRPASTDRVSSDLSPGSSFGMVQALWELNPEDSGAWEEADVNGMEVGYKATA